MILDISLLYLNAGNNRTASLARDICYDRVDPCGFPLNHVGISHRRYVSHVLGDLPKILAYDASDRATEVVSSPRNSMHIDLNIRFRLSSFSSSLFNKASD